MNGGSGEVPGEYLYRCEHGVAPFPCAECHKPRSRDRPPTAAEAGDGGIRLLRAMAKAHRALAEHNEDGPEGWRKEVVALAAGTRTVADDFDAVADELIAIRAALLAVHHVLSSLRKAAMHLAEARQQVYRQREKAESRIEHAQRCVEDAIAALATAPLSLPDYD